MYEYYRHYYEDEKGTLKPSKLGVVLNKDQIKEIYQMAARISKYIEVCM